jgi:hypothetical protein
MQLYLQICLDAKYQIYNRLRLHWQNPALHFSKKWKPEGGLYEIWYLENLDAINC